MARPLRIEFPGALYHVMLRAGEQRRIVRDDAGRQKWIERLRRTVKTCGRRDRRQPRSAPHQHGTAQLSRTAQRIFTDSNAAYSLFTA